MKLTGKIDDKGKLLMANREVLSEWVRQHPNKTVELEIKVRRKKRSNPQNAYYWSVVIAMVCNALRHLGHDVDEQDTHEFLKSKFNRKVITNSDGVVEEMPTSTTKLTTSEMMDYLAKIQMWAAEYLGIVIPDPNEQMTIDTILITPTEINGVIIAEKVNY